MKTENQLVERPSVKDLYRIKISVLNTYNEMIQKKSSVDKDLELINEYAFFDLKYRGEAHGENAYEQCIDQKIWNYLIRFYNLEKYMLCSEYEKLKNQIYNFDFPKFNPENAETWLIGLKALVYDNVQKLIEDVFNRITRETYYTGSGYSNRMKKKRNNNGIDSFFIINASDNYGLEWHCGKPTITDDLEKACYIIDGKLLPQTTIKNCMRKEKIWESENEYFRIRVCKNGNTHYWINEKIRKVLNYYGAKRGIIGENIKIKIFDN